MKQPPSCLLAFLFYFHYNALIHGFGLSSFTSSFITTNTNTLQTSSTTQTTFPASSSSLLVMAVDRTKFRTCSQTSFCRRNRGGRAQPQYEYSLIPQSIQFHIHNDDTASTATDTTTDSSKGEEGESTLQEEGDENKVLEGDEKEQRKGILSSIKERVMATIKEGTKSTSSSSSSSSFQKNDPLDPHYRGPKPFFTATLRNTSPKPSTKKEETLRLNLYLQTDGVARLRITESYSKDGTKDDNIPYAKARWTSDDLILNVDEMKGSTQIETLTKTNGSSILSKLVENVEQKNDNGMTNLENYVAFRYGENQDLQSLILLQFQPFALHMWRDDNYDKRSSSDVGAPLVSVNTDNMMHFEIRRFKDEEQGNHRVLKKEKDDIQNKNGEEGKDDKHGGKEIVGYWEDGLAIYADGTREEKSGDTVDEESSSSNTDPLITTKAVPSEGTDTMNDFKPDTDGMWEERFGDHLDTKPHGPMSVGADISFPSSTHLFGLPEHASSTKLRTTHGAGAHYKEPYRLYNLDVFEYELDETMALYGEVPLIVSQSVKGQTVGVFWFNPSETFVDLESTNDGDGTKTHWISESGVLDIFFLPGPTPKALYGQYAGLTGRMPLPPMFSLGYHQCRWNYRDEQDVYQVHDKFEELDYPYDVLWLDIEHTDGKRYFTWDKNLFPTPKEMQEKLSSQGRNMVTIVDPHIKRDNAYYIHKDATAAGLYIKDKDGKKDYDGWCWPGSSSYLDFTDEGVRQWWAEQFSYERYSGSTPSLFIWNDMNEPSVFNGPEVSMQKDLLNLNGVEHREWHNLFGILFQRATSEGLIQRNSGENERPFVLSRSFFAGSQKYGAIWTGDNESSWSHLKIATPMLLSLNVGAMSFVGADVGGFFGNPDAELMTRWMQAGAYQPFFRGHAHHDAKRREPWMFGDEWMVKMRKAAMARYALLPFWYTVFREAETSGMPVMRTMWMEYPSADELFDLDDQYLIGSDLLVKPVTDSGVTQIEVIFPTSDIWYDIETMQLMPLGDTNKNSQSLIVDSGIDKIPVYQRGGSIIPRKLRLRRSTQLMSRDPYTLYVALDDSKLASGELYIDDEHSFDHERKGHYSLAKFSVDWKEGIRNEVQAGTEWVTDDLRANRMVERIVVMGVSKVPTNLTLGKLNLDFNYNAETKILVVRKPNVSALVNWEIRIIF